MSCLVPLLHGCTQTTPAIVSRINYKPNCPEKKIVVEGKNNNNKFKKYI